jgi:recombination protein RecA
MEHAYDLVLRSLDNRAVDCIVIDSLPALVPTVEDEKEMLEMTMGLGARITGKFLRKSSKAQRRSLVLEDRGCTGLIINQWREKIGVMYGDPRTTPGGKAKNFHYFSRVEVARDEWLKDKDETVGQIIRARTLKNKTYRPQQTAQVDICIAIEVIKRGGAYYNFNDQKWQGKENLLQAVREDIDLQNQLKQIATDHFLKGAQ